MKGQKLKNEGPGDAQAGQAVAGGGGSEAEGLCLNILALNT